MFVIYVTAFSKTLYPLLSTGSTQEERKSFRHDWNVVDWDVKTSTQTSNENGVRLRLPLGKYSAYVFATLPISTLSVLILSFAGARSQSELGAL